jgi:DNA-binding transcriptional LysR family regulator
MNPTTRPTERVGAGPLKTAWPGIELRHLAALAAVAREGSFRGAAEALGYVQSAVSQQLAHLERIVDARLVERRRGSAHVALTDEGLLLLGHSEEILARLRAAQADLHAARGGRSACLSVGVYEPVVSRLMPAILRALHSRGSGVAIDLRESSRGGEDFPDLVAAAELDLAFGDLPLPPGPFEHRKLLRDPYVLLVPADWAFAAPGSPLSASDLEGLKLIGPSGGPAAMAVETALRGHGMDPVYAFRTSTPAAVQALVAAGMGAAITSQLCVNQDDDRTLAVPLGDLIAPRVIAVYWNAERRHSPAVNAFLDRALAVCVEEASGAPIPALAA